MRGEPLIVTMVSYRIALWRREVRHHLFCDRSVFGTFVRLKLVEKREQAQVKKTRDYHDD